MFPETATGDTRGTFLRGAISAPAARCEATPAQRRRSAGAAPRRVERHAGTLGQASRLTKPGGNQAEKVFLG